MLRVFAKFEDVRKVGRFYSLLWLLVLQSNVYWQMSLGARKSESHERNGGPWLPPAHSPVMPAHGLPWGRMFIAASGEALCFVQDPPAPLQPQRQFTGAVGGQSRRLATAVPLNFVQETKQGVEGLCEGQTSWDVRSNNNALSSLFIWCNASCSLGSKLCNGHPPPHTH